MAKIQIQHLLIILFFGSSASYADKKLTFTPGTQEFAILASAVGNFSVSQPFINITLNKLVIRANENKKEGNRLEGVRIGLAHNNSAGRWETQRWGSQMTLGYHLQPGYSREIDNFSTSIPIDGIDGLNNYWFVIEVELYNDNTKSTTYSHSEHGLF
jgi:uncharacterized protein involved in copper resistance